ncbi:hypothetical protein PENSOL_c047G01272 [Penicillium solitum]|uniref:Uncharacterized protein n=1 Tax=Penicillium solitum TaxID=60172 RepID=A0A1V6QRX8_9EURO|nr:uncharacterized protein PENSOL_c047G01272 [Penicillium solitum]OQD91931.1 hypothetical protein PENSOL_c047G01272 [Penicillium solitum]
MTVGAKFVNLPPFNHRDVLLVDLLFCRLCSKHVPACAAMLQFLQARRIFRFPLGLVSRAGLEGRALCSDPSIFATLMELLLIQV